METAAIASVAGARWTEGQGREGERTEESVADPTEREHEISLDR